MNSPLDIALQAIADSTMKQCETLTDAYIKQTMSDPDMLASSEDYRRGYEHGFREASMAMVRQRLKEVTGL